MIELMFELGSETILVVIQSKDIKFGSTEYGARLADISGLQLNYEGVVKEFPDLNGVDNWKEEAVIRFKEKINGFKNEEETSKYIIEELEKSGYTAKYKRRKGFRPIPLR